MDRQGADRLAAGGLDCVPLFVDQRSAGQELERVWQWLERMDLTAETRSPKADRIQAFVGADIKYNRISDAAQ